MQAWSPRVEKGTDFGEAPGSPPQVYRSNAGLWGSCKGLDEATLAPVGYPSHKGLGSPSPSLRQSLQL